MKLLYPQSIAHALSHIEKVDTHWFSPLEKLIQSALPQIKIELYRCLKSCNYLQGQRLIKSTFDLLDQDDFIKALVYLRSNFSHKCVSKQTMVELLNWSIFNHEKH